MASNDDIHEKILKIIEQRNEVSTLDLAQEFSLEHSSIIGHVNSLKSVGDLIDTTHEQIKTWELSPEGEYIVENGSYEAIVYNSIVKTGKMNVSEVHKLFSMAKIGMSKALANGWIAIEKESRTVKPVVDNIIDLVKNDLLLIKEKSFDKIPEEKKQDYKKRKLIKDNLIVTFKVFKGPSFSTTIIKPETDLTSEMIADESWKNLKFKPYNFNSLGVQPSRGHLHPLMKVRSEFREIFLEMGFSEMPTNKFVESSFWNFDALFQPQQHPARDAHDTFFVLSPKECLDLPTSYMELVRKTHSQGGYGSLGYKYKWSVDETRKNLLRTHTTAVSARMLYNIGQAKQFKPVKFFSIDRVFRNETLDATHLAEFQQVEGVIADYNLTLGDLIGVLHEFFNKLGIHKLKFKPAYNPYTEPSMEIFCYHQGLGKWIEVGNSGMFRPEMLLPMGLPENVNVIAWGLSLERPTMIKYEINNIRDLVGPKVQLKMVAENPICRLNK